MSDSYFLWLNDFLRLAYLCLKSPSLIPIYVFGVWFGGRFDDIVAL